MNANVKDSVRERVCQPLLILSGSQVRAARALLRWEQADLAKAAGVSLPTVHRIEKLGPQRCLVCNLYKVQEALVAAGITFIGEGRDVGEGGFGVRLQIA